MAVQKTQSPLALYQNRTTFFTKNLRFVVIVCDTCSSLSPRSLLSRDYTLLPGAYVAPFAALRHTLNLFSDSETGAPLISLLELS